MIKFFILFLLIPSIIQAGKISLTEENPFDKVKVTLIRPSDINLKEISELTRLINEAYLKGEEGICVSDMKRTSEIEIAQLIEKQSLLGLKIGTEWKGCVRVGLSWYDEAKKVRAFWHARCSRSAKV